MQGQARNCLGVIDRLEEEEELAFFLRGDNHPTGEAGHPSFERRGVLLLRGFRLAVFSPKNLSTLCSYVFKKSFSDLERRLLSGDNHPTGEAGHPSFERRGVLLLRGFRCAVFSPKNLSTLCSYVFNCFFLYAYVFNCLFPHKRLVLVI